MLELDTEGLFPEVPSAPRGEYKRMTNLHREVIRQRHVGMSVEEISANTGMSAGTVSKICTSELGRNALEALNEAADMDAVECKKKIDSLVPKALEIHERIMNNEEVSNALRFKVAESVLDRAGFGKVTQVKGAIQHGYSGSVGIELIKQRAREIGILDAQVIPIEGVV